VHKTSAAVDQKADSQAVTSHSEINITPFVIHWRLCSEWESNIVVYNVAHFQVEKPSLHKIDLTVIQLAAYGGKSIYINNVALTDFPHLVSAIKHAINAALHKYNEGDVKVSVSMVVRNCLRIFVWMMRRCIYQLGHLTKLDIDELAMEVGKEGWWGTLKYADSLERVLKEGCNNREYLDALVGTGNTSTLTINESALEAAIGLPVLSQDLPGTFIEKFASLLNSRPGVSADRSPKMQASASQMKGVLTTANLLHGFPEGQDSIAFYPYPRVQEKIAAFGLETENQERILHLEDAILILKEAFNWIYDYAPCVIELCGVARETLEKSPNTIQNSLTVIDNAVIEHYKSIKDKYNLPHELFVRTPSSPTTIINRLIDRMLTAAACIIAFNHGRRRNEVIGEERHYGLYFGCIQQESLNSPYRRIDIYVEKSLQDYADFWCNKLVEDAVAVLENLSQFSRPLGTEKKKYSDDISVARTDKLFVVRRFTLNGFSKPPQAYNFSNSITAFLKLAGVPEGCLTGVRAFRRLFAILYIHRYDHPVLLALKQHFGHTNLASTTYYARAPENKAEAERVEKLFRREFRGMAEALDEARSEYFHELLVRILKGETIGGGFPLLIRAVLKRLAAKVSFQRKSIEEKANDIKNILEKRGYKPNEKEHSVCMLGNANGTKRHANCNRDGVIHQEDASPRKCHGCVNALNTENYRSLYEVERDELLERAKDFKNPLAVRLACKEEAVRLDELLTHEMKLVEKNKEQFAKLTATWPSLILKEDVA